MNTLEGFHAEPSELLVQIIPQRFQSERLLTMVPCRPMLRTYRFETADDRTILVNEEMTTTHFTYLVPSQYMEMRASELHDVLALEKARYQDFAKGDKKKEKFVKEYLEKIEAVIKLYNEHSERYKNRYLTKVPFRSSKQKKGPSAATLRGVPINCHLQMMTVSRYKPSEADTSRYGIVTWGSPAVHCDKFKAGGLYVLKSQLFEIESQRLQLEQARGEKEASTLDDRRRLAQQAPKIKSLEDEIGEKSKEFSLSQDLLQSQKAALRESKSIVKRNSKKSEIPVKEQEKQEEYETSISKLTSKNRLLKTELEKLMKQKNGLVRERDAIQNRLLDTKNKNLGLSERIDELLMQRDLLKLEVTKRYDTALSQALTSFTVSFCFHLEQIAGDTVAMERLAKLGMLAQMESLLSTFSREEGMLEDQYGAMLALQSVAFRVECFDSKDSEEKMKKHETEPNVVANVCVTLNSEGEAAAEIEQVSDENTDDDDYTDNSSGDENVERTFHQNISKYENIDIQGETPETKVTLSKEARELMKERESQIILQREEVPMRVRVRVYGKEDEDKQLRSFENRKKSLDLPLAWPLLNKDGKPASKQETASSFVEKNDRSRLSSVVYTEEQKEDIQNTTMKVNVNDTTTTTTSRELSHPKRVAISPSKNLKSCGTFKHDSDSGTSSGWVRKEGEKGHLFGLLGKPWDRRWLVMRQGILSWFTDDTSLLSRNSLVLDGYQVSSEGFKSSQGPDGYEVILTHRTKRKFIFRTSTEEEKKAWVAALKEEIRSKVHASSFHYAFSGNRFMAPLNSNASNFEATIPDNDEYPLTMHSLRRLIVTVKVPQNLFNQLSPWLQEGKPVRLRPILISQGVNDAQVAAENAVSAQITGSSTERQTQVNVMGHQLLREFLHEYAHLPRHLHEEPSTLSIANQLSSELASAIGKSVELGKSTCQILTLASDLVRVLGGQRLTNCMSGKDRTGMSTTLEQARLLEQYHGICDHGKEYKATCVTIKSITVEGLDNVFGLSSNSSNTSEVYFDMEVASRYMSKMTNLKQSRWIHSSDKRFPTSGKATTWENVGEWAKLYLDVSTKPRVKVTFFVDHAEGLTVKKLMIGSVLLNLDSIINAPVDDNASPPYLSTASIAETMKVLEKGEGGKMKYLTVTLSATSLHMRPGGAIRQGGTRTREEIIGTGRVLNSAAVMRAEGTRLKNCRKNIGKEKYSLKIFARKCLPYCLKPPPGTCGEGNQA
eukprot:g6408.t1